ncbi:MFS transporter [Methylobacterium durans]|uniref:MFS transporter n=1 Tax=Methylobacterium durans TaxID=2202825 RepID=A0A2U8WDG3_9HYPH|nr:MFS transporter [Methylobacterium durans]AWN43558.1 MFS transporter [Methylobacterium durans]
MRHSSDAASRSGRGLDGVNFFVAAVQTGFGSFVTVYLVKNQWPPEAIGFALTIATTSTLVSQIPAGAALDSTRDKRWPVMLGIVGVGLAALLLCVTAARPAVYLALAMQGLASSLIGPGIAAISLALVGQAGMSERVGRNARFASIGNGLAAAAMGVAGSSLPVLTVFLISATLAIPALLSLSLISGDYQRPTDAPGEAETRISWEGAKSVFLNKQLSIFAACVLLFFAASAAMGPGLAGQVTRHWPDYATLIVAAIILVPQVIVAAISPWIGRRAETSGRRPLMLVGWALIPLQGLVYAMLLPSPLAWVFGSLLNAFSGAIFGVMMTVVAADLTRKTGGFNLTLGALGVAVAVGASLSTFFTGVSATAIGVRGAAIGLALVGMCGLMLLWSAMPETRPAQAKLPTPDNTPTGR